MDIPGRRIENGEKVYTDWFPRGGDGIVVRAEVIDLNVPSGTMSIDISVFTKNHEDDGAGSAAGTSWKLTVDQATSTGEVQEKFLTSDTTAGGSGDGLGELVRYEIHASGGGNDDWLLLRIFPPIFFDAAS